MQCYDWWRDETSDSVEHVQFCHCISLLAQHITHSKRLRPSVSSPASLLYIQAGQTTAWCKVMPGQTTAWCKAMPGQTTAWCKAMPGQTTAWCKAMPGQTSYWYGTVFSVLSDDQLSFLCLFTFSCENLTSEVVSFSSSQTLSQATMSSWQISNVCSPMFLHHYRLISIYNQH